MTYTGVIQWLALPEAIAEIETAHDPNAYVDGKVGLTLVSEEVKNDINYWHNIGYELSDFYDPHLAKWAVIVYGNMYRVETVEDCAKLWGCGPTGRLTEQGEAYWQRVEPFYDYMRMALMAELN